jgi:hypothetical protein
VLNHVQRYKCFAGIHADLIMADGRGGKNCFALEGKLMT